MGIIGVILAILAVVCAAVATLLFGTGGGILAGVLAVVAIILGILKKKKDGKGGVAAIVIGVLAVLMAFGLTGFWSKSFSEIHQKAIEYKPDGIWAQVSEETNGGLVGILKNLPTDENSINALVEEMNELTKLNE
ncbi:MAG: hypothetical protein IJ899_19235 [Blautia sp.]|nr:hypothetical protein [Blautia sp.]